MDAFPYMSSYVFIYSLVINLVFFFMPAPYGKFCNPSLPLQIPNRCIYPFLSIGFFSFFFGWFEGEDLVYHNDMPTCAKGWIVFLFLTVHFVWRTFLSHLVFSYVTGDDVDLVGTKRASLLIVPFYFAYYVPLGFLFRRMAHMISGSIETHEYIFMAAMFGGFLLHAVADVWKNMERSARGDKVTAYLGSYVPLSGFDHLWKSVIDGLQFPPNYFFELVQWAFFMVFVGRWEAVWWFASCVLWLVSRGTWQLKWYKHDPEEEATEPLRTQPQRASNARNMVQSKPTNKITF